MTPGAILIGAALLIVILPLVVRPLTQPPPSPVPQEGRAQPAKKQAALASLRDLDFDHQLGRVSKEDYASIRAGLLAQAAEEMTDDREPSMDDVIEERVHQIRQEMIGAPSSFCGSCGSRLDPGDRFCSRCGHAQEQACSSCGAEARAGDVYCSVCGSRIAA
ncbi:MAG TPA: zinc ribbon domain-containing protein [Anaerolineales bacterium]|nr:zinc ribbon domain-containing protein [Anaerolineales bacterium]